MSKQQDIITKLASRKFKAEYTPPQQQVILTIDDSIIGCLSSFVVYSGIPKSCKSTFAAITIASALINTDIFGIKLNLPVQQNEIVLFDTESSEFDFYKNIDKIKYFAQTDILPNNFNAFALREDSPDDILLMIETYLISKPKTSVVVIDGLLDLLFDYNNVVESRQLINWLKRITKVYNCLVIGVLHLGKKDLQTLGHFGSQSDRYAQSTLKIERNKQTNTFDLSASFLRSSLDFEPIQIMYNNGWHRTTEQRKNKETFADYTTIQLKLFAQKYISTKGEHYEVLVSTIKESELIGTNAAKNYVKKLIAERVIIKREKLYFVA